MTGKTHKAIGGAVGVALVLYAVKTEQPVYALGMVLSPFGAMLPDIDHNNSKLGSTRKSVFKVIKKIALVIMISAITLLSLSFLLPIIANLRLIFTVMFAISLFITLALSDKFKEMFPFLTKHRGIMHTLCVPAAIFACILKVENVYIEAILLGLGLGYCSHLLADSFTIMGSPLGWPISTDDVSFARIRTGTFPEYIAGAIISVVLIVYGYMIASDASKGIWLFALPIIAVGEVGTNKIVVILKKLLKLTVKKIAVSLVLAGIMIIAHFVCSMFVNFIVGCLFVGSVKACLKK